MSTHRYPWVTHERPRVPIDQRTEIHAQLIGTREQLYAIHALTNGSTHERS